MKCNRRIANPYRARVGEFPGRLFTFEDPKSDTERVQLLCSSNPEIHLEIGSGSGNHLLQQALKNPHAIFIGFELRYKRAYRTIEKARRAQIDNVYVLRTDAEVLFQLFSPNSLSAVYINFPDPWPKRRTQKKRVFREDFCDRISPLLCPGAVVSFKTDDSEYFERVYGLIKDHAAFDLATLTRDLYRSEYLEGNVCTEFESLFRDQGLPIYWLTAIRVGVK